MILSYKTLAKENSIVNKYFNEYGEYFGKIERNLFIDLHKRKNTRTKMKPIYMAKYDITARQYNAIVMQLEGKIKSLESNNKRYIEETEIQLSEIEKSIKNKKIQKEKTLKKLNLQIEKLGLSHDSTKKTIKKYKNIKFVIHQKKRKLRNVNHKLNRLKNKDISICFGSKNLFLKQYNLKENNYNNHQEWKKHWKNSRSNQFFFVGSKDETFGNQTCTYDSNNNMRIRVANKFTKKYGKYLILENVLFKYGQEEIDKRLESYKGLTKGGKTQLYYGKSMSYRFEKSYESGQWYITANLNVDEKYTRTSTSIGCIGIDLNAGFISVVETDRFGNPLGKIDIPIDMYDRSKNQVKASLCDAIKLVIEYAIKTGKSITIEDLNLSEKKATLGEKSRKYSRMLSGFAYTMFKETLERKAKLEGVELIKVNPAYTSFIGHIKFMKRYGLSSHQSAALVIARRGLGLNLEKINLKNELNINKINVNAPRKKQWGELLGKTKNRYNFNDRIELLKIS